MRAVIGSLVCWLVAGCATAGGAGRSSAEPVEPVSASTPAAQASPAPAPVARRPALPVRKVTPHAPPRRVVEQAIPLEASLRKFQAVRMSFPKRRHAEMPADVERRWHWMLEEVENAVADDGMDGMESRQLAVMMRTRMTLETEFEMDQRRYKEIDPDLKTQCKETLVSLDERIRLLRSLGTGFALQENIPHHGSLTLRQPVQLVNVTSYFGRRRDPIVRKQSRFHAGVDLAGAQGTLVMAAGPGVVAYADWQGAAGNHIIVVHPNGYRTHYSHMAKILVEQGTPVDTGSPLGLMGMTGRSTGPHLHFAVSRHGSFLDPLEVVDVPMGADGVAVPQS